jgi:ABC-type transporter Mla subunit MlaD
VARLLPNPIGDITDKVDRTLADVDVVLGRVDTTLADVSGTLTDVQGLLTDLRDQLSVLEQVPAMSAKLDEIHAAISKSK